MYLLVASFGPELQCVHCNKMHLKGFAALALSISATNAFSDTSPFIFLSSSKFVQLS